jgi:hypothetical protein
VSGLPLDVKPRELYLLFRSFKDYEQSLLKLTGKPGRPPMPVAFVTFENRAGAEEAKAALQVPITTNIIPCAVFMAL